MAEERTVEDRVADLVLGAEEAEVPEPVEAAVEEPETDAPEGDEVTDEPEDDEPEVTAETEAPEFVEIEIDGDLYEVPPKLKDAFLKNSDYTQKTQEVAAQRKEWETRVAQVDAEQKKYEFLDSVQDEMSQIQSIDATIPQYKQYLRDNIDSLSSTDIEKIRFQIEELQGNRNEIAQALQKKTQDFQQAQEQSQKELLDKSTEVLRSRIPDWSKVEGDVTKFVLDLGFSEQQLQVARTDPQQMQMAHDAMRYRQLKDGKAAAVKKVEAAPTIKAKTRNPMPKSVGDKLNFQKKFKKTADPKAKEALAKEELFRRLG